MKKIRLGTRGSALALCQCEMVESLLMAAHPDLKIERCVIKTTGDRRTDIPLIEVAASEGVLDKGVFVKELEVALENHEIDAAVHSLKDVPTVLPTGFKIEAVLERAPSGDVLISKVQGGLDSLAQGAVVATSSVRRQAQLLQLRPDLKLVDIRGNVPTRLEKLAENNEIDAIVLAEAGLVRLGYPVKGEYLLGEISLQMAVLDPSAYYPAAGQGIVGIEVREQDEEVSNLLAAINHESSFYQAEAEREFLRLLEGSCDTPVGVWSRSDAHGFKMSATVFPEEKNVAIQHAEAEGLLEQPLQIAHELYQNLK